MKFSFYVKSHQEKNTKYSHSSHEIYASQMFLMFQLLIRTKLVIIYRNTLVLRAAHTSKIIPPGRKNNFKHSPNFHQQKKFISYELKVSPLNRDLASSWPKYFLIWMHFPDWLRHFFLQHMHKKYHIITLYMVIIYKELF